MDDDPDFEGGFFEVGLTEDECLALADDTPEGDAACAKLCDQIEAFFATKH